MMQRHFFRPLFLTAALLASVSAAAAQSEGWRSSTTPADGSTANANARRLATSENCGDVIRTQFRTRNDSLETNSTDFSTLPSASVSFSFGAVQSRCVKVLFTGEAGCAGDDENFCYIRATDNGTPIDPVGGGAQVFASDTFPAEARAYEWVTRVDAGNHTIRIQGRVADGDTTFYLDDWTLEVQQLE